MTPLIQAPCIIPQLILSLCTVSIATCNKLVENMTPFNGDKAKPIISGLTGNKNFSWVIDTGSAVTCEYKFIQNGFQKNFTNRRKFQN